MKILRLRLSNLNSLRGTTAIDFTVSPLADCGLFAITGPTGAGKTTLLDAVTLALYGRAARYGAAPSPESMMSRHTGECAAEVEFACAAGNFRSVWQLQRARKNPEGKLQAARRRVIALPGETILAESIKDADAKIVELTGLDYDRFLRSGLLAQGEFAAFLRAGPKERTELLQEVTGTAIYRDISQAAFRRCTEAQTAHEQLSREHAALPVLTVEARTQLAARQAETEQRLAALADLLPSLARRITEAERWVELDRTARRLAENQSALAHDERETAPALATLGAHERAAPLSAALATCDQLGLDLTRDQQRLAVIVASLPSSTERLRNAEDAQQLAATASQAEERRQTELRALWAEVTTLDRALAVARESVRQNGEQHTRAGQASLALARDCQLARQSLDRLAVEHATAATWLRTHVGDAALAEQLPEIQSSFTRWAGAGKTAAAAEQELAAVRREADRLAALASAAREKLPALARALGEKHLALATAQQARLSLTDRPLPEIEGRRDAARERRNAVERLDAEARRLAALVKNLADRNEEARQNAVALDRALQAGTALGLRRDDAARVLEAHRRTLAFAERVRSLESHRTTLRDGEPCPLCGGAHHPFASPETAPPGEVAAAQREVDLAIAQLKSADLEFARAEKTHAAFTADQKRIASDLARLETEHAVLRATWNAAATALGGVDRFPDATAIEAALIAAQADEQRLTEQLTALRAAEFALQTARESAQETQAVNDQAQAELAKHEAVAAQIAGRVPALEAALARGQEAAQTERETFTRHLAAFSTDFAHHSDASAAAAACEQLKQRAATFRERDTAAQSLHSRVTAQAGTVEALNLQMTTARAVLDRANADLVVAREEFARQEAARREKFGDRSVAADQEAVAAEGKRRHEALDGARAAAERRRADHTALVQEKTTLETAIARRVDECRRAREELDRAASAAGFAAHEELRAALLAPAEAATLAVQRRQLEERRIALNSQLGSLQAQRTSLPITAESDAGALGELRASLAAAEAERTSLDRAQGETLAALKHDDEQRQRQAAFATQIAAAHREFARWDRLRALIGSADGSAFARFAQGLTLERLTVLANHHLARINPRYAIRCATGATATDLELEIVDRYQADVARPMRSLSGGETFLASLALALGLAELASGRTSIESLFIDEGFGSLDLDTLETAMAALDNLQARGKTIGVISHVPAMQERITTQIQVTKEAGGWSRVTVSG